QPLCAQMNKVRPVKKDIDRIRPRAVTAFDEHILCTQPMDMQCCLLHTFDIEYRLAGQHAGLVQVWCYEQRQWQKRSPENIHGIRVQQLSPGCGNHYWIYYQLRKTPLLELTGHNGHHCCRQKHPGFCCIRWTVGEYRIELLTHEFGGYARDSA